MRKVRGNGGFALHRRTAAPTPPFLRTVRTRLAHIFAHLPLEREAAAQRLELILDAMQTSEAEDERILAGK